MRQSGRSGAQERSLLGHLYRLVQLAMYEQGIRRSAQIENAGGGVPCSLRERRCLPCALDGRHDVTKGMRGQRLGIGNLCPGEEILCWQMGQGLLAEPQGDMPLTEIAAGDDSPIGSNFSQQVILFLFSLWWTSSSLSAPSVSIL